ncbi:MAG: type II secretion system F family protein [Alphaproteobacteria bacterium]
METGSVTMFQNAAYALIALLVVGTLFTILSPLLEGDKLKKRMTSVSSERDSMRDARLKKLKTGNNALRTETKGFFKNLVDNLSLEKLLEASNLRDKLAQAGLRGQRPVYMFYIFRFIMPIALGIFGLLFLVLLNIMDWTVLQNLAATLGLVSFGYYAPAIYLKNKATKRMTSITPAFPDALDLLLICVESGMSVELAFARVAKEMAENSVELAEEFSLTTAELSYLQSRRQAFENLARRNNHVGIRSVSTALVQAERYGTPLGNTLRTMANENRQMRMLQAEKKAAALPAKLTIPMILFFLPVLFIVILTPAVMRIGDAL